jgi:hypothetical protein
VSEEEKPDWWVKSQGQRLHPRFELIDEYRRASGGQTFHMVNVSTFLDLSGADKTIVEEVRDEEQEQEEQEKRQEQEGASGQSFGVMIQKLRQERRLRPIDIERISDEIAGERGNPEYRISHATLMAIEDGSIPSIFKLISLASALGVSLGFLLALFGIDPNIPRD